jgi:hypothetical protein
VLPIQPLQRELGRDRRYVFRPMVGNEFHVQTSFGTDLSWKALLQLDQNSEKICLPLCDVTQHPLSSQRNGWPSCSTPSGRMRMSLVPRNVANSGHRLVILICRITNFSDGLLQRISTPPAKGSS